MAKVIDIAMAMAIVIIVTIVIRSIYICFRIVALTWNLDSLQV